MYKVQPYDTPHGEMYLILDSNFNEVKEASAFLEHAVKLNRSPNTIRGYAFDIVQYYRYAEYEHFNPLHITSKKKGLQIFNSFTSFLLMHSKGSLIRIDRPSRSDNTINRILGTIYQYYQFLYQYEYINENLFPFKLSAGRYNYNFLSGITKAKLQRHSLSRTVKHMPVKFITRVQYEELLNACRTLRDRLIIALLFETGMRAGELAGLHISDLTGIERGIISVVPRNDNINHARVKRNAAGRLKLPDYVTNMLIQYLSELDIHAEYLFSKTTGKNKNEPITTKTITKLFENLSKRTGLKIHPHMTRHGFAIEKLNNGWSLYQIQSYLRHANPVSTQVYAEYTDELKIKIMSKFNENIKLPEVYKNEYN